MKVNHIRCGPPVNESERKAAEYLKERLKSLPGISEWILLSNLTFSFSNLMQSDEIDLIVIGPPGPVVIEIKHWASAWVQKNSLEVESEAEKLIAKVRKVATTLRKHFPQMDRVEGRFLITREGPDAQRLVGKTCRSVRFFSLADWRQLLNIDGPPLLSDPQMRTLCRLLEPTTKIPLEGDIRRFGALVDLEIQTPRDDRFRRVYRGRHSIRQDRVYLHLFDLSASDNKDPEKIARREFEALHRLQLHPWAPRILDSFQDASSYPGELYFFTLVDPAAPSIKDRATDSSWSLQDRMGFAKRTIECIAELHAEGGESPLVHRNLTPATILVRHDGRPILTGFHLTKIPTEGTVASAPVGSPEWNDVAPPEALSAGLAAMDQRSDVYMLCASLKHLFTPYTDPLAADVLRVLDGATADDPSARRSLEELRDAFAELLGESITPPAPPARYWSEEMEIDFRGRRYRVVTRLGQGGIGAAFKVVELDRKTGEELGTYVAKVVHDVAKGQMALQAYHRARPHTGHSNLSVIFETATEWRENEFVALMRWVEGTALSDLTGVLPLLAEDLGESSDEALGLRWVEDMCRALGELHRNGLIHGDVSPRNLIVSGASLVLTDYDFVTPVGSVCAGYGTVAYCSPEIQRGEPTSPSDDIYALAASLFGVLSGRPPFQHGGATAKERGLNWTSTDRNAYSRMAAFFDTATNPDRSQRFKSVQEVLEALHPKLAAVSTAAPVEATRTPRPQKVDWLLHLLQS